MWFNTGQIIIRKRDLCLIKITTLTTLATIPVTPESLEKL